jgi:hypothetical protein
VRDNNLTFSFRSEPYYKHHNQQVLMLIYSYIYQIKTLVLLISNSFANVLKGGKEMDTGIAYIIVGVMILVRAIIAGGSNICWT